MQKFWYHSPVRFYPSLEDLEDMTNPQNTQYFGNRNYHYPLQISEFHRFLIPNYQNEVLSTDLELWLVGDKETQIACEFGIDNDKLFRVTFKSKVILEGRLEIRLSGNTIFYSNCVGFVDSTDANGRKFIRVATKHTYDRNLFKFSGEYDWIVTNLPAYCLGQFTINADVSTSRVGGNNTLKTSETYLDEVVKYEFITEGDSNILAFIQVHSTNNEFYIDGTKRTAIEKLDVDEFAMNGRLNLVNVKDGNGMNITLDELDIFEDVIQFVLSNQGKSLIYVNNENKAIVV